MRIGTRSVLFGAHQFLLHPWFVAWGWWRLYGFPWDLRLWVAFFVHDIGYLGAPNMDGEEGERHPILGARIMGALFDRRDRDDIFWANMRWRDWLNPEPERIPVAKATRLGKWGRLVLFHSRFFAQKMHREPSRLCYADKLAIVLTPRWLYLPMVRMTGELDEYMDHAIAARRNEGKYAGEWSAYDVRGLTPEQWHESMVAYLTEWVEEHAHG